MSAGLVLERRRFVYGYDMFIVLYFFRYAAITDLSFYTLPYSIHFDFVGLMGFWGFGVLVFFTIVSTIIL